MALDTGFPAGMTVYSSLCITNSHDWQFNEKHMGAGAFVTSAKPDVLLVGDSIVLGGNPLSEVERLGPQLAKVASQSVWPISAGSWALRNELAYLRANPCNGQVKQDTLLSRFLIEFPFIFERGLIAYF